MGRSGWAVSSFLASVSTTGAVQSGISDPSWRPVHTFKYLTAKPRLYRRERDMAHFSAFSEIYSADKYRVARRFAGSAAARTEGDGLPSEAYTATLHRPHGAAGTMRRRAASFLHGTSDARPSRVDFCRRVDIFF